MLVALSALVTLRGSRQVIATARQNLPVAQVKNFRSNPSRTSSSNPPSLPLLAIDFLDDLARMRPFSLTSETIPPAPIFCGESEKPPKASVFCRRIPELRPGRLRDRFTSSNEEPNRKRKEQWYGASREFVAFYSNPTPFDAASDAAKKSCLEKVECGLLFWLSFSCRD